MRLVRAALVVAATLAAIEVLLRGLVLIETSDPLRRMVMRIEGSAPVTSEGWAARYLREVDAGGVPFAKTPLFKPHETRGWTHAANVSVWIDGYRYTTNSFGHRALVEPETDHRKPRILVIGNSQTFGEEVDDAFPWPTVLAQRRTDLEIVNMAVGGYGLDQMLVTFEEEVERWRPDIAVIAAIPDDFYRTSLWFREAPKPYFVLSGGELRFNRPRLDTANFAEALRARPEVVWRKSLLFAAFAEAYDDALRYPQLREEASAISRAIMERAADRAGLLGLPLVLTYFAEFHLADLGERPFERDWRAVCASRDPAKVLCPDWRRYAPLAAGETKSGHYRRLGHQVIAQMIEDTLQGIPIGH